MNKKWLTKVITEGDDIVVLFPQQLLDYLNLHEGEVLLWTADDDGKVTIEKTNIVDQAGVRTRDGE